MADEAIPAATLILIRDGTRGPEVLMVQRSQGMAFAAGAWVFPGGRIDDADRRLAEPIGADPAVVAAIRETIEETAIPIGIEPLPDADEALDLQSALAAEAPFASLLNERDLTLNAAALTPFARWVPQFHAVRRFDTMFYLARCSAGEREPGVIEGECASAAWLRPADVLEQEQLGEARLIFPTRRTLERLAQHSSWSELEADARAHAVEPITPWVEEKEGEKFITIPSHLGFPVTQERLDGLWRG